MPKDTIKIDQKNKNFNHKVGRFETKIKEIIFVDPELSETPLAYDEEWIYLYTSECDTYTCEVGYFGHPQTHLELSHIQAIYIKSNCNEVTKDFII